MPMIDMPSNTPPDVKGRVICMLGMHRSGTSMVSQLLSKCGVSLGKQSDILAPNPEDNPAGYWENQRFVEINDDILTLFGGTWKEPPKLKRGWFESSELDPLRNRAIALISDFGEKEIWGWKDPRTCLTLEFWQSLIPQLEYIVCIREPADVAHSLAVRRFDWISKAHAFDLWSRYYEAVMSLIDQGEAVICQYESFSYDPSGELNRILSDLRIDASRDTVSQAAATIRPDLWRNLSVAGNENRTDLPKNVLKLYLDLCAHSGPIAGRMKLDQGFQDALKISSIQSIAIRADRTERMYIERSDENERLRSIAFALSSELAKLKPPDTSNVVGMLVTEAGTAQQVGDLRGAELLIQCATMLNPRSPDPLYQLGVLFAIQGRVDLAAEAFSQCVRLAPREPAFRHQLARALEQSGKPDQALEQMDIIVRDYPQAFRPHYDRANMLLRLGRNELACRAYETCLNLEPRAAEAMLNLGLALEGLGELEKAAECYRRALRNRPGWDLAVNNLNHCEALIAVADRTA